MGNVPHTSLGNKNWGRPNNINIGKINFNSLPHYNNIKQTKRRQPKRQRTGNNQLSNNPEQNFNEGFNFNIEENQTGE